MNIKEKIQYWAVLASDNLETAKILLKKKKYLDCGFYCHQVIEKILKSYYWFINNQEPPYIHNLIKLSEKSKLYDLMSKAQKKFIDLLMPLNIEARYPDEKEEILQTMTKKDFKKIFKNTEELYQWILQLLKK